MEQRTSGHNLMGLTTRVDMSTRADTLTTKADTARAFARSGSGRAMTVAVAGVLVGRIMIGSWTRADLAIVLITIVLTGPVEWILHRTVLHASLDAWSARVGLGEGHRRHHLDPGDLQYLMLAGREAVAFLTLLAMFSLAWAAPVGRLLGADGIAGPVVTAVGAAWVAVAHYEWTHLLVHTRYRPRSRYYRRLDQNHRLHHYRNEGSWLGVTSNMGDRLFRTLPPNKAAVPLSPTARTLID